MLWVNFGSVFFNANQILLFQLCLSLHLHSSKISCWFEKESEVLQSFSSYFRIFCQIQGEAVQRVVHPLHQHMSVIECYFSTFSFLQLYINSFDDVFRVETWHLTVHHLHWGQRPRRIIGMSRPTILWIVEHTCPKKVLVLTFVAILFKNGGLFESWLRAYLENKRKVSPLKSFWRHFGVGHGW